MVRLAYILLCLVWGSTWMFIKVGLDYFSPVTFAAVRFILTAVLLFLILLFGKKKISIKRLFSWPAIVFGVLNGLSYALVFEGENRISSSLTAVLNAILPFFTLLLATFLVNERITLRKTTGLTLGFLGILFLYWHDLSRTSSGMILGGSLILIAAFCYALGGVIAKKYPARGGVLEIVTAQMTASACILSILALLIEPVPRMKWTTIGTLALLYLAVVGSAVAFLLYNYLLKKIEVSRLSYVSMITPILAVIFGVVFLHEPFSLAYLWTLLAVLGGIYIITT